MTVVQPGYRASRGVQGWSVAPGGFPPCTVVVGNPWIAGGTGPECLVRSLA